MMLGIEILCIGKLNQKFYKEGCDEYHQRLSAYAKVTVTELAESRPKGEGPAAERLVVEDEGARLLTRLTKRRAHIVALCIEGRQMDSQSFADTLRQLPLRASNVVFVIGGSRGLSDAVKQAADLRLSLSSMTMPHQLARLVLMEQLYRACSINAGAKYHK